MRTAPLILLSLALASGSAMASTDPFIGVYHGDGRACTGGLYLRQRTLEWHASFFRCGPVRYQRIAEEGGDHPRVALRLSGHSKACGLAVVEIRRFSEWSWTVNGYPSMETYVRREEPGWKDSVEPGRQIASCGMRKD